MTLQQLAPHARHLVWGVLLCASLLGGLVFGARRHPTHPTTDTEGNSTMTCVHCGRDGVGTYARGYGYAGGPLCHPNDDGPDCYTLVTRNKHPMPCDCSDDKPALVPAGYFDFLDRAVAVEDLDFQMPS